MAGRNTPNRTVDSWQCSESARKYSNAFVIQTAKIVYSKQKQNNFGYKKACKFCCPLVGFHADLSCLFSVVAFKICQSLVSSEKFTVFSFETVQSIKPSIHKHMHTGRRGDYRNPRNLLKLQKISKRVSL